MIQYPLAMKKHLNKPVLCWRQGLCLAALAIMPGCIERTIHITSDPQGALVHLNDEEVGRTPLTVPFTFYGIYDVSLQLDGYQTLWTQHKAKAPWWETPGPDLIAEAIPGLKSKQHWHFQLQLPPIYDQHALIERAQQLWGTLQKSDQGVDLKE